MLLSHGVRGRPMPVRPGSLTRREHQIGGDLSRSLACLRGNSHLGERSKDIILAKSPSLSSMTSGKGAKQLLREYFGETPMQSTSVETI